MVLAAVWVSPSFVTAMKAGTAIFGGKAGLPLPMVTLTSLCCCGDVVEGAGGCCAAMPRANADANRTAAGRQVRGVISAENRK
jgi:hypothetical protein